MTSRNMKLDRAVLLHEAFEYFVHTDHPPYRDPLLGTMRWQDDGARAEAHHRTWPRPNGV